GEGATELVHIGQAVLNLKGTFEYFVENTFNYPTLAEAYKIAGLDEPDQRLGLLFARCGIDLACGIAQAMHVGDGHGR
ncbi:hypothetical protein ACC718_39465, partial [Rhizobium ruizarguesonis]